MASQGHEGGERDVRAAVRLGGHGPASALHAAAAAAALLVQELPRHLEPGRGQEPVALPAQVDRPT